MDCIPNDTLDWATYAFQIAILQMTCGENQSALNLLQQALTIRKRFEKETDQINELQRAIDVIQRHE
jgi:pSer/pThr/pTyr-binding forkhead associated (FHA) protein